MRFLPLVLLLLFVPLAFVRFGEADRAPEPAAGSVAVAAGGSPVALRPTDDLAEILPGDALVVVRTADWDAIRERAAENTWVRFLADRRVSGGVRDLASMLAAGSPAGAPAMPSFGSFLDAIHGGFAFFLVESEDGGFAGGILLQPLGDEGVVGEALKGLLRMVQGRASLMREHYADVELTRIVQPGEDEVTVVFATDELVAFFFAPDAAAADLLAHGTIDRHKGLRASGTFAESVLARSAPGAVDAPALSFHLDVQRLLDAAKPGWRDSPDARALEEVGLGRIRWVHALAELGKGEELELAFSLHVPEKALLGDLADAFGPLPTELLERFPGRSLGVGFADYDVAGAFDAVQAFLGEHHPGDLEELRAGLAMGGAQLGVDLERDLIDQLTGRFGSFTMRIPESELSALQARALPGLDPAAHQGGVWFVELREVAPVERVIERVLETTELDVAVELQTFEGTTVHTLAFDDLFRLHWAFTDDGLFVSEYESALIHALTLGEDTAARSTRFLEGLPHVAGASAASLVDTESSVAAGLALISAWLDGPAAQQIPIPLPPLPDPSIAEEFFGGTLYFTVERGEDRLDFRFRAR